jgi:predicted transcriptional regulator
MPSTTMAEPSESERRDDRDRFGSQLRASFNAARQEAYGKWPLRNGYLVDILRAMSKVLITVPDELLDRIDRAAKAQKTTRSRFIEEAAQHELGWPAADSMDAAVNRAREALASAGPFESAGLIRRDRDSRDATRR